MKQQAVALIFCQALGGLHARREAEERLNQAQSGQAEAWGEERAALLDRVALLEDSLAASSASAAAAADTAPTGASGLLQVLLPEN